LIIKILTLQTISTSYKNDVCEKKVRKTKMFEKLQEIIADQLGIEAGDVHAESSFKEDLSADSLDLFEMVMSMEDEFDVEIPSEDLEKILTVQDVIDYLKAKGVEE
jgi:acyl carrier protein